MMRIGGLLLMSILMGNYVLTGWLGSIVDGFADEI